MPEPEQSPDSIESIADDSSDFMPESAPPEEDIAENRIASAREQRDFEDLNLMEALGLLFQRPVSTWRALWAVARAENPAFIHEPAVPASEQPVTPEPSGPGFVERMRTSTLDRQSVQLGIFLLALVVAWFGSAILVSATVRTEEAQLSAGAPFLLAGFLIWLGAECFGSWRSIRHWWTSKTPNERRRVMFRLVPLTFILAGIWVLLDSMDEAPAQVFDIASTGFGLLVFGLVLWALLDLLTSLNARRTLSDDETNEAFSAPYEDLPWYMRIHPARVIIALLGSVAIAFTWIGTSNNNFTTIGFYAWLASIALWTAALAPAAWRPRTWPRTILDRVRAWRPTWVTIILVLIMLVGAIFRLSSLDTIPPEMTSDHVEKILDAQRVYDGSRNIFFANNGGREPFQMYALALFAYLPGQSVNFDSLKLLAVIESLITLPVLYWLGREIAGPERRKLGIILGLGLAALVAVSYWHVAITRLSLRIILTPLVTSLLLIALARAMRHNRRGDFIMAGLVLGFGLYTYQAVRMLPVVVVAGIFIAAYMSGTWRTWLRYGVNLAVLVLISFIVFVPMFHYSVENPELFWLRTSGRLLGDDVINETLEDGTIIQRDATAAERLEAFNDNVPVLMSNIRNALLMFNWKGDVAWINGAPNQPAMDQVSGALLIVGLAAWLAFALRRRDPVLWLIPLMIFIMLLPSALSIAYPIENPSHTRTSGALPAAYMIAALPLALITERLLRNPGGRRGLAVAAGLWVFLLGVAYAANTRVYFEDFRRSYLISSLPYSDAGQVLQGFALSDGSYGNAFMIAYPFWWDHRAIGLEAGLPDWPNGIISINDVPSFLRDSANRSGRYRLLPDRDLLFFYSPNDEASAEKLAEWFPEGRGITFPSYQAGDDFMLYRVPALGADGFQDFLARTLPTG